MFPDALKGLYGSHIKVLMYAMAEQRQNGVCRLNRRRIGKSVGLDRSGINRTLRYLERIGLIQVDRERGTITVTSPFWIEVVEAPN